MKQNLVMLADSYKYSHASQYPGNMVSMYDYMESRGGTYSATVFTGLQGLIKNYLLTPITMEDVDEAYDYAKAHGVPFDIKGWTYIVEHCKGILPIRIKAVKEGTLVPVKHVLLTVESTDNKVPWIAGWLETLLMKLWYPTTIATKSYYTRKMLEKYGDPAWVQFAYHNFGGRGSASVEAAAIGGYAHLTQFSGTDNFNSLRYCKHNYLAPIAGFSVFATEHSTTTSHAREGEEEFVYRKILENPNASILSFVGDSYDIYNFTHFCTDRNSRIRELIESRPNQKLVIRPDSGDHMEVINRMLNIIKANNVNTVPASKTLFKDFGILWGDGITSKVIEDILGIQMTNGFAAENFVFGSGGDLMQNVNRDTQRFAIKCSSITIQHGTPMGIRADDIDVYKDPITDPGKTSKRGKVTTWFDTDTRTYIAGKVGQQPNPHCIDALITIFENGKLLKEWSLDEIRQRTR